MENNGLIKDVAGSNSDVISMKEDSTDAAGNTWIALGSDSTATDEQCLPRDSLVSSKFEKEVNEETMDNNKNKIRMNEEPNDIVLDASDSNSIATAEQCSFQDSKLLLKMNALSITQEYASDKCSGGDMYNSVNDVSSGDFNATATYKQSSPQDLSANFQKAANVVIKEKSLKILIIRGFNYLNNSEFNMNDYLKSSPDRKKLFKRKICPQSYLRRRNLNEHIDLKHGSRKLFECDTCSKSFKNKRFLIDHIRVVHGEKRYKCTICHESFALKKFLENHKSVHIDDKPYKCGICSQSFKRKGCLKVHTDQHQRGTRWLSCTFANCTKLYKSKGGLNKHILSHTASKRFECQVCNKSYRYQNVLKTHINTVHNGSKPFQCNECGKTFGQKASLAKHKNAHDGIKAFKCAICDKSFRQKSHLKGHIFAIHYPSKLFECEKCDEKFQKKSLLKSHLKLKHNQTFKCDTCYKSYLSKSALKKHTKKKHDQKKSFECQEFGKSVGQKGDLSKHKDEHKGIKDFKCDVCDKSFKQESHRETHRIKVHYTSKSFKCDTCHKLYLSKDALKKHTNKKHDQNKSSDCETCPNSIDGQERIVIAHKDNFDGHVDNHISSLADD